MGESLHAGQSVVLTRETPELASSLDDEEVLEDLDYNYNVVFRSTMKWWLKYISMIISKTASRNVAFTFYF